MPRLSLTALLATLVLASALPAQAERAVCGPRDGVIAKLQKTYGETRESVGLNGTTALFEVWTSEKTGSWTILMTRPDGLSCIVAAGENWQSVRQETRVGDPA